MPRDSSEVAEHLDYLSRTADELKVSSPIPAELVDLVGRHEDLRAAARVWRKGAEDAERACGDVQGKLSGIDSAWEGKDADAFLAHIRETGLAGTDLVDTMRVLADVLDQTADAVQDQLDDVGGLAAEAADSVSGAMAVQTDGDERVRKYLADLAGPVEEMTESISDTYRALARFCADVEAGRATGKVHYDRRMPAQPWDFQLSDQPKPPAQAAPAAAGDGGGEGGAGGPGSGGGGAGGGAGGGGGGAGAGSGSGAGGGEQLAPGGTTQAAEPSETPAAAAEMPAAGAVAGAAGGAAAGGGMMGMMPMGMMGGMMGGAQGGGNERRNESRFKSNPQDLFGGPPQAPPAVFEGPLESDDEPFPPREAQEAQYEPPTERPLIDAALHPQQTAPAAAEEPLKPPTAPAPGDGALKPPTGPVSADALKPPTGPISLDALKPPTGPLSAEAAPKPAAPSDPEDRVLKPPAGLSFDLLNPKKDTTPEDEPKRETAPTNNTPPKPKTGTASVGDAPPPKPRD